MSGSQPSDAETPLRISLNRRQRELLMEDIFAPDHLMRPLRVTQVVGGRFHIRLTMDQLDELLDCIEDTASGTRDKKLQKEMYDLCEHLEQFGLRKIVYMERLRPPSDAFKQAQGYSEDGTTTEASGGKKPLGEEAFSGNCSDRAPGPQGINRLFLNFLEHHGRIPRPELGGLSREQLVKLLKTDWDDDHGPIKLDKTLNLKDLKNSRILHRARIVLGEVVESGGVKATPAGNLTRKFVGLMLDRMTWPDGYLEHLHLVNKVLNEQDVFPLHIIRIVLALSGLLVSKNGVFSVTKEGKSLLSDDRAGLLFQLLFKTLFQKMNLSYLDGMPELTSFQETLPYSLFMLSKIGMRWKRTDDLARELLLPPVRLEMENTSCPSHWYLSSRFLTPLEDFGLLQTRKPRQEDAWPGIEEVRKTTLFNRFLRFRLQ